MSKTVLVTGASRGIGKAIALQLAQSGYRIGINYLKNKEAATAVMATISQAAGEAYLVPFDVADRNAAREAIEADIAGNGSYWAVICNAGVTADAPLPMLSGENWDKVVHTNLDSFYNVLHPVMLPMLQKKAGGRIITLSSISGIAGNRGQTNYAASKAGIIGATKSLALEVAKRNITVNCVAPGLIETDMTADLEKEDLKRMIPMRRFGKTEEVASLVRYLLTDEAGYITGQVISVNGGLLQ